MATPPLPALKRAKSTALYPNSIHDYKREKTLGKGNFGRVHLARNKVDNKEYAVKEMNLRYKSRLNKERAVWEVKVAATTHHPYVIEYKEAMFDNKQNIYIVMEYAQGGTLKDAMERECKNRRKLWSEDKVVSMFLKICLGMKHVHDHKILHRDLKSENVFLTADGTPKIGDFGLSRVMDDGNAWAKTAAGTPLYICPEMLQGQYYNQKADVWSLGIILYEMMTGGRQPFTGDMRSCLWKSAPKLPSVYSADLRALCRSLLNKAPTRRPSVDDILRSATMADAFGRLLTADEQAMFDDEFHYVDPNDTLDARVVVGRAHADNIQRGLIGTLAGTPSPAPAVRLSAVDAVTAANTAANAAAGSSKTKTSGAVVLGRNRSATNATEATTTTTYKATHQTTAPKATNAPTTTTTTTYIKPSLVATNPAPQAVAPPSNTVTTTVVVKQAAPVMVAKPAAGPTTTTTTTTAAAAAPAGTTTTTYLYPSTSSDGRTTYTAYSSIGSNGATTTYRYASNPATYVYYDSTGTATSGPPSTTATTANVSAAPTVAAGGYSYGMGYNYPSAGRVTYHYR